MKYLFLILFTSVLSACPPRVEKGPKKPKENETKVEGKNLNEVMKPTTEIPPKTNYTIVYPKDWEKKSKFMGTDSLALSPLLPNDTFRENVNVVVEHHTRGGTNEYFKANLKTLKKVMNEFKVITSKPIKLSSGIAAHDLIYQHKMGELSLKVRAVFIEAQGRGYVISCTASPETYQDFEPKFDEIVQSFRVF